MSTLRELYAQPETQLGLWTEWYAKIPFEEALQHAEVVVAQPNPAEHLDALRNVDGDRAHAIGTLLLGLKPNVLYEQYGIETLAWAAVHATLADNKEVMMQGLADHAGFDTKLFAKACKWNWRNHRSVHSGQVLSHYKMMEYILDDNLNSPNLKDIIADSPKPGVTLSEKRLDDYSLEPVSTMREYDRIYGWVEGWVSDPDSDITYDMYLDTPTGLLLKYKGVPNAILGIAVKNADEVMIHQMQGVRAIKGDEDNPAHKRENANRTSARGLAPLDWQKVFVHVAANVAQTFGLHKIGIQSGEHNNWTTIFDSGSSVPHLPLEAAIRAYDEPAERLGFTKGDDGDWHKDIPMGEVA